jgi:hypothetical protein
MAVCAPDAGAETARQLSDFTAIEEPTVRYLAADDKFEPDEFVNITDQGDGIVRMTLRYDSQQWDGDRDLQIKDRQRAEVKGLGALQKDGEIFEYATTWRTNTDLRGSDRFCHVFQLKATDGDKAPPLIVLSILKEPGVAAVRYCSGKQSGFKVVREFPWQPATWQTVKIRVKVSESGEGEIFVSVDGDAFVGTSGIPVFRPDATKYRPKWGFYRGVRPGMSLGNDYVEHREASASRVLPTDVQPR